MSPTLAPRLDEDLFLVEVERFQGPLELLLHLIRQQDIDILDIPISRITGQFLVAVERIQTLDLDRAGEFLEMAATLVRIKAQLLLPIGEALGDGPSVASLEGIIAAASTAVIPSTDTDPFEGLWGVIPNALERAVRLSPQLPDGWPEMTLERLRIGDTRLDLRVRRRPAGIAVKARRTYGPAIALHLAPRLPFTSVGVLIGDQQLPGPDVRFTLEEESEGVWFA